MTDVRFLKNGAEAFPAMFKAVVLATSTIALEMYYIADDRTGRQFHAQLIQAAKRGIHVLILVDAWGSMNLPDEFWNELRVWGGVVRWFHPLLKGLIPFRDHQKLFLIDDHVAYIGGINIADKYFYGTDSKLPWRDNVIEISGADVARLRRSFSRMWAKADSPYRRLFHRLTSKHRVRAITGNMVRFLESGPENRMRPVRQAYLQLVQNATIRMAGCYLRLNMP